MRADHPHKGVADLTVSEEAKVRFPFTQILPEGHPQVSPERLRCTSIPT